MVRELVHLCFGFKNVSNLLSKTLTCINFDNCFVFVRNTDPTFVIYTHLCLLLNLIIQDYTV